MAVLTINKYIVATYIHEFKMPQRVICHECRYVLYEDNEFNSLNGIILQHAGTCPKCDRKLSSLPINVEVKSANK